MNHKVVTVARYLLGAIFLIFGLNGLMMIFGMGGFIPLPKPGAGMQAVMGGLFAAGYLMPTVKILEVVCGVMLLSGKYVTLALCLLAPIVYNILGLHLFVELGGLPVALVISVLYGIVFVSRCDSLQSIFKA